MPAAPDDIAPGTVIDGKYEVIELLGVGGMGKVYRTTHVHLGANRCIKLMKQGLQGDESLRQRFLREAVAATRVQHPNVAVVHDFSSLPDGTFYLVSEFIAGITLRQRLRALGAFPIAVALEIVLEVLSGLGHCHRKGLLHRDISSDNIMIDLDDEHELAVKIIDLGVAKLLETAPGEQTRTGLYMGNPKYSSPEQLGALPDGEEVDARADLYCLGVVLFEIVAGIPPFRSSTPHGYAAKHLTQAPPTPTEVSPDLVISRELEAVILKALEKDRRLRYSSAEEFAAAIRPFAPSGGAIPAAEYEETLRRFLAGAAQIQRTARPGSQTPTPYPDGGQNRNSAATQGSPKALGGAVGSNAATAYRGMHEVSPTPELSPSDVATAALAITASVAPTLELDAARGQIGVERTVELPDTATRTPAQPAAEEPAAEPASAGVTARAQETGTGMASSRHATMIQATPGETAFRDAPASVAAGESGRPIAGRILLAVVVAAILLAATLWIRSRSDQPLTADSVAAPALPSEGAVVIDVLPWARVDAIVDANGTNRLPSAEYTPLRLTLPPGNYTVRLIAGDGKHTQELPARVDSGQVTTVRGEFGRIDPQEYFRSAGW